MKRRLRFSRLIKLAILCCGTAFGVSSAVAQNYQVLHNFNGADAAFPESLTMDASGNFYGLSSGGGMGNNGVVFQMSGSGSGWTVTTLYTFRGGADGSHPVGKVVIGPDGGLYGMTEYGGRGFCTLPGGSGCGTIFELKPPAAPCLHLPCPWTKTILYSFAGGEDGGLPMAEPVFDNVGNMFGTTFAGGSRSCQGAGCGTVFELTLTDGVWTETQIYAFSDFDDGGQPAAALTFANYGKLYGTTTTTNGHKMYDSTAFQITLSAGGWTESRIFEFNFTQGSVSRSAMILDSMGNLYGAMAHGPYGTGPGNVFELSPSGGGWKLTILHQFDGDGHTGPYADLTMDNSGNIYGTTYGGESNCTPEACGTIFELARSGAGWTYTQLYNFPGGNNGEWPISNALFDNQGNLFGTASSGGTNNLGVVFESQSVSAVDSNLGPNGNTYNCCTGWTVAGSGAIGASFIVANQFTVPGSGNIDLTQVDVGMSYTAGTNTFYGSIWTDGGGVPGTQVSNAYWPNLAGVTTGCCNLVRVPVSGVMLTGGQSYFMILGPMELNSDTWETWNWNNQGVNGVSLYSNDGGQTWNGSGAMQTLGAFDILGIPE